MVYIIPFFSHNDPPDMIITKEKGKIHAPESISRCTESQNLTDSPLTHAEINEKKWGDAAKYPRSMNHTPKVKTCLAAYRNRTFGDGN